MLDLTDVRFTEGIFFAFPEGAILLPGPFAVVVHDDVFRTPYPDVDAVAGVYGGNLSNAGEILELRGAGRDTARGHVAVAAGSGRTGAFPGPRGPRPAQWGGRAGLLAAELVRRRGLDRIGGR